MAVIERYIPASEADTRVCQQSNPSDPANRHFAEVILQDGPRQQQFLCKAHAQSVLASNQELLAKAVIELSIE